MATRRDFLTSLFGAGAVTLVAACGGGASQTVTPTSATKPAAPTTAAAPPPTTQSAPAQAAAKPAGSGGTITFVIENDVIDFDPLLSRAFVDRNAQYQIYDSLVRVDPSGKIIPWLAEKWDTSADGKQVTFNLRNGVKYQDGSPFDADSVKWNIDRYRTTDASARKGELAPVASVDVVDAQTVRFNLTGPFSPLLSLLVDRAGMMVSRKVAEAAGEDFTRKAFKAGTGPFVLTEAVKDDHVTMERNPDWWGTDNAGGKLPLLDKIIIRPITNSDVRLTNLKTGDAHFCNNISPKDVAGLKNDSTLTFQEVPGYEYGSLVPNRKEGFVFSEARYVKALSMAIDRKELIDKAFFGVGSVGYGTIAPAHFAFDANFKPFEKVDAEGAKKLVADVGKGPLSFELLVPSGDPALLQQATLIQAQLRKADIDAQLAQLEFAQILKQQTDKVFKGVTFVGWSGRVDPDGNTYDFNYTGRPNNDGSYSNPEVDKLLDDQRQATDEAKRKDALRKAEQIFVVDDPARVWFRFAMSQMLTAKKLTGLQPYPDRIPRFQTATLAK
ncbi:MAG TPA: ABC transporter substrate-binding protein [Chloroflexota bacterium]|nr:ABC transporter substrate-binding protein [Chloroflexota bacterium]